MVDLMTIIAIVSLFIALAVVGFDIWLWVLTQRNISGTMEKTAIRARNLILDDDKFKDTDKRLEKLDLTISNLKFPSFPPMPIVPTIDEVRAVVRSEMPVVQVPTLDAIKLMVKEEIQNIRMPAVPSAIEIAAQVGASPQVLEAVKTSMDGAVKEYLKGTGKGKAPLFEVVPAEVQEAEFNQWADTLSPFVGEDEAVKIATSIAKAPPMIKETLIDGITKKLKRWGNV